MVKYFDINNFLLYIYIYIMRCCRSRHISSGPYNSFRVLILRQMSNECACVILYFLRSSADPRNVLKQYRKWLKAGQEDNNAVPTRAQTSDSQRARVCYWQYCKRRCAQGSSPYLRPPGKSRHSVPPHVSIFIAQKYFQDNSMGFWNGLIGLLSN